MVLRLTRLNRCKHTKLWICTITLCVLSTRNTTHRPAHPLMHCSWPSVLATWYSATLFLRYRAERHYLSPPRQPLQRTYAIRGIRGRSKRCTAVPSCPRLGPHRLLRLSGGMCRRTARGQLWPVVARFGTLGGVGGGCTGSGRPGARDPDAASRRDVARTCDISFRVPSVRFLRRVLCVVCMCYRRPVAPVPGGG